VWLLARRKPLGAVSAMIVLGLVVVAILAPVLAPRDPYEFNLNEGGLPIRMQAPTAAFPLGTDPLGRDVLSRIVYGARVSLIVGLASVIVGTLLGTVLGLVSGYWEGKLDQVIQRGVDTTMAIPGIVLALAVMSVLGQSLTNIILVIALVIAPGPRGSCGAPCSRSSSTPSSMRRRRWGLRRGGSWCGMCCRMCSRRFWSSRPSGWAMPSSSRQR